ncbi:Trm112 family protein [Natronoglycomyces albus]|uniref:Trm112 family protein n=1 Tax=Natronoglycomyces albus TaxID=2811108 RepID=A0A895XNK5_9ACTN|nr:Trm112 family protein [Natronoglycomyces albus]
MEAELSSVLLELLRCPKPHHAPLSYDRNEGHLTCSECGEVFRVEDGIPVMLVDEELER